MEGARDATELLLRQNACTDLQDKDGNTALHLAIWKKSEQITELLLGYCKEFE